MQHKNILILGASGQCGQWATRLAQERGHNVLALVRSLSKYDKPAGIQAVEGDVLNGDDLDGAMEGQDAVLSCLGIRRKSPANPWSPVVSPPDLTSRSALSIVRAMNNHGVRRLVAISAAGVGDSRHKVNPVINLLIRSSNVAVSFRDMEKMEDIYRKSEIDSLAVQPVNLVDDQTPKPAKLVDRFRFSSRVSRRAVAEWMLDALERPSPFENSSEMIGWS